MDREASLKAWLLRLLSPWAGSEHDSAKGLNTAKTDKLRTLTETLIEIILLVIYRTARGPKPRAACKCVRPLEKPREKQRKAGAGKKKRLKVNSYYRIVMLHKSYCG